jgi:hypothetical protein
LLTCCFQITNQTAIHSEVRATSGYWGHLLRAYVPKQVEKKGGRGNSTRVVTCATEVSEVSQNFGGGLGNEKLFQCHPSGVHNTVYWIWEPLKLALDTSGDNSKCLVLSLMKKSPLLGAFRALSVYILS